MDEIFTVTIAEYSKRTRIGINTIRRLTRVKGFPIIRIGRKTLIPVKAADDWILEARAIQRK